MDKTTLCRKLKENKLTLDELRGIPYEMAKDTVADILVEMYYAFYIETDELRANRAILACLLERWWDELDEV